MPRVQVHNVGDLGIIVDTPDHMLPPEAWSAGINVRFDDGSVARTTGYKEVFHEPNPVPIPPEYVLAVPTASTVYWVYASLNAIYAYGDTIHSNLTPITDNISASEGKDWNGGTLGGVPVINNGTNIPYYWPNVGSVATPFTELINWPATIRAEIVRPFRNYLIALNLTISGGARPHRVRWSHAADPGTVPDSWDIADPTKDAGEVDLTDVNAGAIRDGQILRDFFVIYKDDATHVMRYIGGGNIFQFQNALTTSGILAPRCAAPIQNGKFHFVHTGDDLIVFGGSDAKSVLDRRWRKTLNAAIDSSNFANSFCFNNPTRNEATFAFPSEGALLPNRALIWNYEENTISYRDFLGTSTGTGVIEQVELGTWDEDEQIWDADPDPWARALRRQILVTDPTNTKFYQLDEGNTAAGDLIYSYLERTGIALLGRDRSGKPRVDMGVRKLCKRIWPKVPFGQVSVQMGAADDFEGTIVWQPAQTFNPLERNYLDFSVVGRLLALRFESVAGDPSPWKIDGYDLEIERVSVL